MQHELRYPVLGADEFRQGDYNHDYDYGDYEYDDDEARIIQVFSHQTVRDIRNVVACVESCCHHWDHCAYPEVAHNIWHSRSNKTSNSTERLDHQIIGERHEVVLQKIQVARQKEEVEAKVVECYERVTLSLLLPPSRELVVSSAAGIVGIATVIAAAITIAATVVSVGCGTLVQGNF